MPNESEEAPPFREDHQSAAAAGMVRKQRPVDGSNQNSPPLPSASSGSGDASRRTKPPQCQPQQLQPPATIRKQRGGGGQSSSLLRIIAVSIAFVLAFHWYLVLHHVNYHAPPGHHRLPGWADRKDEWGGASRGLNAGAGGKGKKGPYVLSPVCGGCYRTYDGNNVPCYNLIQQHMKEHNASTLSEASQFVGTNVAECGVCDPVTCYTRQIYRNGGSAPPSKERRRKYRTKYWRFDQTAPRFTSPTSLVLPSIPDELRIPPERFDDIEAYIKAKYAHPNPENITNVFLFEYNPGLAPVPHRMRAYLPWNARYLLSLRVTPHNLCFPLWLTPRLTEDQKQTMHSLNHLGLALLDDRYRVIPDHDVVIDIDRQLGAKRESFMGEPAFVDYRVFALNDEIYLHVNSDTVILTKLKLRSKGIGEPEVEDPVIKKNSERQFKLKNLYGGDLLEVTMLHQFNTVWGEGKNSIFGKNYALFSLPNMTHPGAPDAIYAEMSVYPDHRVQRILPDEYDWLKKDLKIKWRQRRNFKIDHIIQRKIKNVGNATVSVSEGGMPLPSFFTVDEHWFPGARGPFKEFAHGGACCVGLSMELVPSAALVNEGDLEGVGSLFVGVGHTLVKFYAKSKVPIKERGLVPDTNYVSFLYAFDPRPPFKLLARSGYFCLGFANGEDSGPPNPHSVLTHNRPLRQNNETFACPQIHYVETIVDKADDPSIAIVGYGMNDCTARLVEVTKEEIARVLFPDPRDLVVEEGA